MRRSALVVMTLVAGMLASVLAAPANATYAGGEGKLAFVRANQIYTVASTGGAAAKLTSAAKNYRPTWSPDGTRIAYIHESSGGSRDVWVMSATGTGKTRVTSLGTVTTNPTWSPDGTTIAFGAGGAPCDSFDCSRPLYTIGSTAPFGAPTAIMGWINDIWNGPDPDNIVAIMVDRTLAWSPDGSSIFMFSHLSPVWDDSLAMLTLATGEDREIQGSGGDCCGMLGWSDLAWGPTNEFGYGQVDEEVGPASSIVYPGFVSKAGDKSPAPSPLNTHMAFTRHKHIYVSSIQGTQRRVVTKGYQPDWQPLP